MSYCSYSYMSRTGTGLVFGIGSMGMSEGEAGFIEPVQV